MEEKATRKGAEQKMGTVEAQLHESNISEEALRKSEVTDDNLFRTLFDSASDGFMIMKGDLIIDCNRKILEMFGRAREEMIRKPPWLFSPPRQPDGTDSRSKARRMVKEALSGASKRFEWVHTKKTGVTFYAEVSMNTIELSTGVYVLVIIRDITESKEMVKELRKSHDFFNALINAIPMALFTKDRKGRYGVVNDNFAEYIGLPASEIEGKTVHECWPFEEAAMFHGKDIELMEGDGAQIYEYRIPHAGKGSCDGIFTKACFHYEDGSVAGLVGTFLDITERKRMEQELAEHRSRLQDMVKDKTERLERALLRRKRTEEALRESESRYRTLFESASDAGIIIKDGLIVDCNLKALEMFGYTREEIVNHPPCDFSPPDQPDGARSGEKKRGYIEAALDGQFQSFEWKYRKKDGTLFDGEVSMGTIGLSTGIHILVMIRDVTGRKAAEKKARIQNEKLIQADKMISLGILVSGVAHEINNPNNFIMLNTPILKDAWASITPILEEYFHLGGDFLVAGIPYTEMREDLPELFTGISEGSERIKQIVNDLKDYARQDVPEMTGGNDVNRVLEKALSLLSNLLKSSTDSLKVVYGKGLPLIRANSRRLEQVLVNLIQNACQALPDPSRGIEIETGYDGESGRIVIRVRDEGDGISPEDMKHILDPFFTTKRTSGGTGLGLSISAGIVEQLGGTLRFESEKGKSTVAEILLPVR